MMRKQKPVAYSEWETPPELKGVAWIFWLDKTLVDPKDENRYRVLVLFKDSCHQAAVNWASGEPMYWTEETCLIENTKQGKDLFAAMRIELSALTAYAGESAG
jgi:hypothetical protein